MVTSTDIVNEALQHMGGNSQPVTGIAPNFDNSTLGKTAAKVYAPAVAAMARQFSWDFARTVAILTLSGNVAPFPWAYEYLYPAQCVQIWQLAPATLADPNNPLPTRWSRGVAVVTGVQSSVIWSNVQNAQAIFNGNPSESTWDTLFRQAVVRMLASIFAMADAGKVDFAQAALESSGAFETIAESRDS
jgi:hypothetical protein